jgi:hypothetical protein
VTIISAISDPDTAHFAFAMKQSAKLQAARRHYLDNRNDLSIVRKLHDATA